MARILFVNQYYWPDLASTGQHLTDLAEHLAAAGHEVRVLCSRGRYLEGKGDAPAREVRGGVDVRRVRATSFGKRRPLGRLADYLSFHALVGARTVLGRWPDIVVTLTTPPLVGLWGAVAKRVRRRKHVCFVMDLHPDAEFEMGMLRRDSLAGRLLELLSAAPMRGADRNVVLGPYQASRLIKKDVSAHLITEIPIWSDGREIRPIPHAENPLRAKLGWGDDFVVVYSGNAGLVHCFSELLEAARLLADLEPRVRFAFVGGGPRTPQIRAFVEEHALPNVEFHPYFPREELALSLSAADAHFLSLRPEQTGVAVPGKLYGCLAAGRPVLFVGAEHCESADAVRASGAGFTFRMNGARALADRILAMRADPEGNAQRGRAARAWFLEHHERRVSCEKWRLLLEEIAGSDVHRRAAVPAPAPPDEGVVPPLAPRGPSPPARAAIWQEIPR